MAVVLADRQLTVHVRAHQFQRDAHGTPMPTPSDTITVRGPYPGAAKEQPDGSYTLRVDPRAWEIRTSDKITDDQGNSWIVFGNPRLHGVPGYADVDYIAVTAQLEPPQVP